MVLWLGFIALVASPTLAFVDIVLLFMVRVCHAFLSVQCSLVVTFWERADHLALLCVVFRCVLSLSRVMSLFG